jgi:uncharacterized protein (TIRG00374 family)
MDGNRRQWWRTVIGAILALLGLVWVFHDLSLADLAAALQGLHWGWIPLAVLFNLTSYTVQGKRWSLLLQPVGRVGFLQATGAVYAGLFVNELLPLRPGEFLRATIVSGKLGSSLSAVIPSMVIERFLEGIWLAIAAAVLIMILPLPPELVRAGDVLGAVMFAAVVGFLVLVLRDPGGDSAHDTSRMATGASLLTRLLLAFRRFLAGQLAGVRLIGRSSRFWAAFFLTALLFLLQGVGFWVVMLACRLPVSLAGGIAIYFVVFMGTALPNAPGNVGTYQFFCVLGLSLLGLAKPRATAFSLVAFFVLTVPLWAAGYLALRRSGLSLHGLRRTLHR